MQKYEIIAIPVSGPNNLRLHLQLTNKQLVRKSNSNTFANDVQQGVYFISQ
jgi:hypothetical protein